MSIYDDPLITYDGAPTDAFFGQLLAKVEATPTAVWQENLGARSAGAHVQAASATLVGDTSGAGTSHMTFTDGPVTVEADVPLPGSVGDRTNVVIDGV